MLRARVHDRQAAHPAAPHAGPDHRSERALQAMAEAVERSRRGTTGRIDQGVDANPRLGGTGSPGPAGRRPAVYGSAQVLDASEPLASTAGRRHSSTERALRASVAVAGALLLAVAAAALLAGGGHGSAPASAGRVSAGAPPGGRAGASPASPKAGTQSPTPSATLAPTPSSTAPASGSGPVVTAVVPASGAAGAEVSIEGSGLVSADGRVEAVFDGQPARTECPGPDTCAATVPALPGPPRTVSLVVVTAAGSSRPVAFAYGGTVPSPAVTPGNAGPAGASSGGAQPPSDGTAGGDGHHRSKEGGAPQGGGEH